MIQIGRFTIRLCALSGTKSAALTVRSEPGVVIQCERRQTALQR